MGARACERDPSLPSFSNRGGNLCPFPFRRQGGGGDFVRIFEAAFQDTSGDLSKAELLLKIDDGRLSIEGLAGEDVNPHIPPLGESMDTDVAFSDENKPGPPPVQGVRADILTDGG